MMTAESQHLLADYVASGSERAFQELVTRYVDLVYSAALRLVDGDTHRAEDVAQTVFIDLARMAPQLAPNTLLGGWLHRHTCFVARTLMRGERRRHARERQAVEMSALESHPDAALAEVAAVLDEAIHELGPDDRDAILLRFFERRNLRAVGEALGTNENVAQKRVARAVQELALLLRKRGFTLSAAALAAALSAGVVKAAPAGLALGLAKAALAGAGTATSTAGTAAKLALLAKLKLGLVSLIIIAGLGTMVWLQFLPRPRQPEAQQLPPPPLADPPAAEQPSAPVAAADPLPPIQRHAATPVSQPSPEPPPVPNPLPAPVAQPAPSAVAVPATASPPGDFVRRFVARSGSRVRMEGTANMLRTRWQIQGEIIQGTLDVGSDFPVEPGQVATPGSVMAVADVFIPVTSLKSVEADGSHYSDAMDTIMYERLKADVQKKIYFHLTELVLQETAKAKDQPYVFEATGNLAVAGVTNQLTMPVQVLPLGDQRLKISGATLVKMTDFQMTPPVALGGALKTSDEVKLSFDWLVALRGPSPVVARKDLVPLVLKLPMPAFKSEIVNIPRNDNVERPSSKPRPPLLVPPGLTNLARGCKVTSSDKYTRAEALAKIVDGDKEATEQSVVFLRKGAQWVQLDLGSPCEVFAVALWHAHDASKVYRDVVVQIADDPDFTENVHTLFNNDRTNALGLGVGTDREYVETFAGKLIDAKGTPGQYLRFYSRGSSQSALNEYTEIEVHGRSMQ
jgi:RNA polymerase sigma factor (sigma-70 family)